jgi:hypothetical protein
MTATVAGTFATGANGLNDGDQQSEALVINATLSGTMLVTTTGDYSGSNKIRLQKSTDNGETWANFSIISSEVANQAVNVAAGEQWRASVNNAQVRKTLGYKLTLEN